jgi:hypothetical protein
VQLNQYGRILEEEWLRSQLLRREVALDAFVVMPDHFHGIVVLSGSDEGNVCETAGPPITPALAFAGIPALWDH